MFSSLVVAHSTAILTAGQRISEYVFLRYVGAGERQQSGGEKKLLASTQ